LQRTCSSLRPSMRARPPASSYRVIMYVITVQVVRFAEDVFQFKAKYESSAPDSFLPPNTVAGNDPVIVLAIRGSEIKAVR
jgi:hypothetical protein